MAAPLKDWSDITAPIGKQGEPEHYHIIRYLRDDITHGMLYGKPFDRVKHIYECRCDICGTLFEMNHSDINLYPFKSNCPNCKKQIKWERKTAEFTESRIGSVIGGAKCLRRSSGTSDKHARYVFKCPYCGKEFDRTLSYMDDRAKEFEELGTNRMIDCGCQQAQYRVAGQLSRDTSIGGYASPNNPYHKLYTTRRSIISRCTDPDDDNWDNYGGRTINPIHVLPPIYTGDDAESVNRDMQFLITWSLENGWTPDCNLVLDHTNTNDDYKIGNIRWVTARVNTNNRRKSLRLQFGDQVYDGSDIIDLLNDPNIPDSRKIDLGKIRTGWSTRRATIAIFNATCLKNGIDKSIHWDPKLKRTVDRDGFINMIPRFRLFPLYPDDFNGPVTTYEEYLDRIRSNHRSNIRTLVLDGWYHQDDIPEIDIKNDPLIVICKRTKSIRPG